MHPVHPRGYTYEIETRAFTYFGCLILVISCLHQYSNRCGLDDVQTSSEIDLKHTVRCQQSRAEVAYR